MAKPAVQFRYNKMERLAVRVELLYEAAMVEEVELRTIDVPTVKVAPFAPAGIVRLDGTLAAKLLLESATLAPPAGAGALRVTVPIDDCNPPTTLVGFTVSEVTVGSGKGLTVSDAVFVVPA